MLNFRKEGILYKSWQLLNQNLITLPISFCHLISKAPKIYLSAISHVAF